MEGNANQAFVTFAHPIASKLDSNNYIVWRKQVLSTLRGHNLQKFLLPEVIAPPEFTNERNRENGIVNPQFTAWDRQDQLIISWLMASMSDNLLSRMVSCETSAQIWSTLKTYFASQIRAKISQFKTQLNGIKKGSMSINDYLLKIRSLIDLLAMVGEEYKPKDHIDAIFGGLPEEYEMFIMSLETRVEPLSVLDVESLLLTQESRI